VKARRIKGLDARAPLLANVALIVTTRLEELAAFVPAALAPDASEVQHDMRIAAKRLRYVLETAGTVLGEPAEDGRRAARELQEVLGDLHDCDVRFALVGRHLDRADPPADHGLELLLARTAVTRDELHARFVELWSSLQSQGVWDRLATAAGTASPHD
jgi:CHAD domain-containing protein